MLRLPLLLCGALLLGGPGLLTAADAHAGHDHAGHDHSGHNHGPLTLLGKQTLGGTEFMVGGAGQPQAGGQWHVAIALAPGAPAPKAIRLWVGNDTGRGSEKAKASADAHHPGMYATHVAVPTPLPADSKLWVSFENAAGEMTKTSLPLVPPAGANGGTPKP